LSPCDTYIYSHTLIAFDNFFTSHQLLKTLNERGLYAVGTVRGSRKGPRYSQEKRSDSARRIHVTDYRMCGSNKVAGQQTCDSSVHVPQSQASHFRETKNQRWYVIDCSLPRLSCRVQFNNGRSRSLRLETREICNWEALTQMVAPPDLLSHLPCDCQQVYNVELQQWWST
jgi:hypothetical protein